MTTIFYKERKPTMKSKLFLKEKAFHGTALVPIAVHRLSYPSDLTNFFFLHWHYEFEFVVVLKGGIVYTIEDTDYCLLEGDGLFVQSNQLHSASSYNGLPCEACAIVFHPNLFGANSQGTMYSKFVYPILSGEFVFEQFLKSDPLRPLAWQQQVLTRLKEFMAYHEMSAIENELILKSKIFEIWHHCFLYAHSRNKSLRDTNQYKLKRMEPVLSYIHDNYREEITLLTLAQLLPMSEGQFCRAFKELMHITPIAYVIRYRILQSCILLTQSDMKIADIAHSIGFNNISYYNREFHKAIACSPSRYRNEES